MPVSTANAYASMVRRFFATSDIAPSRIRSDDIVDFARALKAPRMRRRALSALHSFFAYCEDRALVDRDPSRRVNSRTLVIAGPTEALLVIGFPSPRAVTWIEALNHIAERRCEDEAATLLCLLYVRIARTERSLVALLRKRVVATTDD